ncbi:MAG: hypothetical protein WCF18_20715, partial [Chthoniobacteraceae bacterium]
MISRSRREVFGRALLIWLIAGASALAQQTRLEVRLPAAKLIETAPGRIVTVSVVVANPGRVGAEIIEKITLPPGCEKVAPPDLPFGLEAGSQAVRVLAVLMPATMPAGRFEMRYAVRGVQDPASQASIDLAIQVTPVDALELVVPPRPDVVLAGDVYPVTLRVTNRGNSRLAAQLTSRSSLGFAVTLDSRSFPLEAGASREIICQIKTEKAFAQHTHHAVTFDLTAASASGKILTASQASVVEIIPLVSGNDDPFHHLPLQLRFIGIAETGHDAQLQTELAGAGSLDEAGRHRIDFLFRGPDVQNASLFGERDEYVASYHSEKWDLDLGDRIYSLSPLTEKHSLGRGAGVTWHEGRTAVGGFYMSSRYRQQKSDELGAFVRRDLTGVFSMQGNFLRKTGDDLIATRGRPQNLATFETNFHFRKLLDLRLEAGASRSDDGTTDSAYRGEARGELPSKVNYAIEHIHAGPDFHGYSRDTDTTCASVTKAVAPGFRVHASLNRYAGNLALNDVRSSVVNRENSANIGASYALNKATEVSLEWQHIKRADILLPAAYDFTEDSARVGFGHTFGKLQMQSFLDLGTLENSLSGEGGSFQRYNLAATWHPTSGQSYSVFTRYGPSSFTGSTEQALSAGASARWQFNEHFTGTASYARNQYDGLIGREQDQALASLCYQMKDKSSFAVVGRWAKAASKGVNSTSTNEAAILATYSIPLSLPVSRKRSIGALQGRLFDAAKGRDAGLPRVVLQVGEQFAVTDAAGLFEFPSLKPGRCE